MKRQLICALFAAVIVVAGCKQPSESSPDKGGGAVTPAEAGSIARDAYIYGVPMVAQYQTMYAFSIDKSTPQYRTGISSSS